MPSGGTLRRRRGGGKAEFSCSWQPSASKENWRTRGSGCQKTGTAATWIAPAAPQGAATAASELSARTSPRWPCLRWSSAALFVVNSRMAALFSALPSFSPLQTREGNRGTPQRFWVCEAGESSLLGRPKNRGAVANHYHKERKESL